VGGQVSGEWRGGEWGYQRGLELRTMVGIDEFERGLYIGKVSG